MMKVAPEWRLLASDAREDGDGAEVAGHAPTAWRANSTASALKKAPSPRCVLTVSANALVRRSTGFWRDGSLGGTKSMRERAKGRNTSSRPCMSCP